MPVLGSERFAHNHIPREAYDHLPRHQIRSTPSIFVILFLLRHHCKYSYKTSDPAYPTAEQFHRRAVFYPTKQQ